MKNEKELVDMTDSEKNNKLFSCLEECEESCLSTIMHSLAEESVVVTMEAMVNLMDCEQICSLTRKFILRDSDYAGDIVELCACICEACAKNCRSFHNDEAMHDCAEVCENCAMACREIIQECAETTSEKKLAQSRTI